MAFYEKLERLDFKYKEILQIKKQVAFLNGPFNCCEILRNLIIDILQNKISHFAPNEFNC